MSRSLGLEWEWRRRLSATNYALQPIVNIHTGLCYGYEALLRNVEVAGFATIGGLFDRAFADGMLGAVDRVLREKALRTFSRLKWADKTRLFYNIDNRLIDADGFVPEEMSGASKTCSGLAGSLCLEISERHPLSDLTRAAGALTRLSNGGCRLAIDDFGTGHSGLQLLYYVKPDFIKIDRFFIQNIAADPRKRMFAESIVKIAHLMGSIVIAEGVETPQEYFCCRKIGCDLLQGYLVQHPTLTETDLRLNYRTVQALSASDRRYDTSSDKRLIKSEIEYIAPVPNDYPLMDLFDRFRTSKERNILPVVDHNQEPVGVIRELTFKDFAYSRYGRSLLSNPTYQKTIKDFIAKFPVADIHTPLERILEIYTLNEGIEGILMVNSRKYIGFLSARSILKTLNEKNLAAARDQNPLSKLPGNTLIYEYVSNALQDSTSAYHLVYFDFDNFKAYNDTYGFRHGDRVILLFSELLKTRSKAGGHFAGHIGGDDFFLGIRDLPVESVLEDAAEIADTFRRDVESFYDPETIRAGFITAKDRVGADTRYPLMTVSTVVLTLPCCIHRIFSTEEIGNIIATLKKEAKQASNKIRVASIRHFQSPSDTEDSAAALPAEARPSLAAVSQVSH